METIEEFCGSPFWDFNLSWNTEISKLPPDLTPCFQDTVLVWIPCACLWIFSIFNVILCSCSSSSSDIDSQDEINVSTRQIESQNLLQGSDSSFAVRVQPAPRRSREDGPISWNLLNLSKVVICVLLILTQVLRLAITLKREQLKLIVYPVDTYTPILRISTYALAIGAIVISKTKGTRSSVIQFTFWFLLTLCQLFKYRTTILKAYGISNNRFNVTIDSLTWSIILELIDYPLIVGQFILHCWADSNGNEPRSERSTNAGEKLECPQNNASVLSKLFFSWFDSFTWICYRNSLDKKDLWELNPDIKAKNVAEIFDERWSQKLSKVLQADPQRSNKRVSVLSVIFSSFGTLFIAGSVLTLIPDLLAFVSPQILSALIAFMDSDQDNWKGYFYAVMLFLAAFVSTMAEAQYMHIMYITAIKVKSALVSVLYRKSLVISNASRKETTTGEIVNLMSVDVEHILAVLPYINMMWVSPLQIILALYFLWGILGPSIFAGVGVMLLLIPINGGFSELLRSYQTKQMANKDERVKLITEILSGIKILKLYAWEPSFQEEVTKTRSKELQNLKSAAYLSSVNDFLWNCSQFLVSIATFATYVLIDEKNVLDAKKIFVSLSLFNVMMVPLTAFPMLIIMSVQAGVSLGRLSKFMNAEEIDTEAVSHDRDEVHPIVIENGYFFWSGSGDSEANETDSRDENVLKNINVRIQRGSLVAVVGPVGSGKSSLLSAILGELEKSSGRVNTDGNVSYVAQQAWIQNGTLQENILFGEAYTARKYNRVINACSLTADLDIFPGRDNIEIGEKGINLSGGQKQRVSIARACYKDSDLYLLDDPLSAVDSHVGKHIFEKVLSSKGLLGRKTRVLVTNSLHFLHQVDSIVVMKNGEISQMGTYTELMGQEGPFAELINQYRNELAEETHNDLETTAENQQQDSPLKSFQTAKDNKLQRRRTESSTSRADSEVDSTVVNDTERLIEDETMETASVKWSIYLDYIKAAGWGRVIVSLLMYLLFQAFAVGSNFWLNVWSTEPIVNGTQGNRDMYLGVYAGLGVAQSIAFMVATVLLSLATLRSSSVFHFNMLARILRAPMSFFDTTPSGRIVNRFSKDVDVTDNTLPEIIKAWLSMVASVFGTLFVIIYTTPIFTAVIVPIGIFYYFIQKFYVPTTRQLQRFESVTRSPIYSHFGETINGASTIRAYGEQQRFITDSEAKLDNHQACYFPSVVSDRWLEIRLETTGSFIIFFAALFAVLSRDTLNPGLVGLAVSYSLQITFCLGFLVRSMCQMEADIVAVERMQEYGNVPQEAPWECSWKSPSSTWPANGSIQFRNYQTRYREGLDLVLKNITCDIEPGEKIGVVGRTGAGKSSLTLALFRIIEGVNEGSITVDGEDIRKLGLHDVRSRLTIIPQDPVLFSGTLRFNLDPFVKYSDSAVWRALELSNLKTFVEGLQGELQFKVSEGGDNLSVGQKQLVCLARALLRKSKILVLDEATAAVDVETDDLIQKTIRSEFNDSTVVTIAHRLNTIMDSTRVMVISNGAIAEFDSPAKLLENTESQFYAMANDAGIISKNPNA